MVLEPKNSINKKTSKQKEIAALTTLQVYLQKTDGHVAGGCVVQLGGVPVCPAGHWFGVGVGVGVGVVGTIRFNPNVAPILVDNFSFENVTTSSV